MKIGEVAKALGINSSAIRFYERNGLINANRINRAENGYRVYSQQDVEDIQRIMKFKAIGLELHEIKSLLQAESSSCGDLLTSLDEQIEKCEALERVVQERLVSLRVAKDRCQNECKPTKAVRACCV